MAGFLDLPATALAAIASSLGISDKKNLALTCKAMSAIIRPLWISLLVDLVSEEPPPAALINFSGMKTIVVVDSRTALSVLATSRTALPVLATSTEPAFYKESEYEMEVMALYDVDTLDRVSSVISTVLTAAATLETEERRELSLRMAVPGTKTGAVLQAFIDKMSPKLQHGASNVTLAGLSMLLAASSLLPGSNEATAADTPNSSADPEAAILRRYISKLVSHPAFADISDPNGTVGGKAQAMFSRATSALDHIHHLSNGGSPYYPITSVDAGWFIPDGYLTDRITKGTVAWCEDTPYDQLRLELYTQLRTLRICVLGDINSNRDIDRKFARLVPDINSLPMLRELHLCRPDEDLRLTFPNNFMLPNLTRLDIGEGFHLDSFEKLTPLCALQQLVVDVVDYGMNDAEYSKRTLGHLAPLSNLTDLEVSYLNMYNSQNIEYLTAITSLKLFQLQQHDYDNDYDHFDDCYNDEDDHEEEDKTDVGPTKSFILPDAPMPRLKNLHLMFSMNMVLRHAEDLYNSDEAIEWVLKNGATTFPGIETMRLGVLELKPPLNTKNFTVHLASSLMDTLVHPLLSTAPNLKYLAIEQARMEDVSLLDAAVKSGEFLNHWWKEIDISTSGSRIVRWLSRYSFTLARYSGRDIRAHFQYTRM